MCEDVTCLLGTVYNGSKSKGLELGNAWVQCYTIAAQRPAMTCWKGGDG